MKNILGIAEWCLNCSGIEVLKSVNELGLENIHLNFGNPGFDNCLEDQGYLKKFKKESEIYEIDIKAVAMNCLEKNGIIHSANSIIVKKNWDIVRRGIEASLYLDASLIYIPSFNFNQIRNQNDFNNTIEFLRKTCLYCAGYNIQIASENTLSAEENLIMAESIADEKFRILIDTYNPVIWGNNVKDIICKVKPYMCDQVHVKDGVRGIVGDKVLGEGDGDFINTLKSLAQIDFSGCFILENNYMNNTRSRVNEDCSVMSKVLGDILQ